MCPLYGIDMFVGHRYMKAGNTVLAARTFDRASKANSISAEQKSMALHMLGVCQSVLGNFESAEWSFEEAESLTSDAANKLHIQRDQSALARHMGLYGISYKLAGASYYGLVRLALRATDDKERARLNDEAYASLSFLGEVECLLGEYQEGTAHLWIAYTLLHSGGNDHYLLNAIVRLLKYCPESHFRMNIVRRALSIARKDGNKRRMAEIVILTLAGRRTYNLLERLYRA